MAEVKRYYYKSKDGKGFLNLKSPLTENVENYDEITKEEFDALTYHEPVAPHEPTPEEIHNRECDVLIGQHKAFLSDTDYVVLKIAEALANKDTALVASLKEEYADVLEQRTVARSEINRLQGEIVPIGDAPVYDPTPDNVEEIPESPSTPETEESIEEPVDGGETVPNE